MNRIRRRRDLTKKIRTEIYETVIKKIQPIFLHSLGYWTLQKQDEERIIKAEISCQWVTEDHRVF